MTKEELDYLNEKVLGELSRFEYALIHSRISNGAVAELLLSGRGFTKGKEVEETKPETEEQYISAEDLKLGMAIDFVYNNSPQTEWEITHGDRDTLRIEKFATIWNVKLSDLSSVKISDRSKIKVVSSPETKDEEQYLTPDQLNEGMEIDFEHDDMSFTNWNIIRTGKDSLKLERYSDIWDVRFSELSNIKISI